MNAGRPLVLLALIGCVGGPSARAPSRHPAAWLVVAVYDDGLQVARKDFASREEAEAFVRRAAPEPGDSAPILAVQRDVARLHVRVDVIEITAPHHITMRENWLQRNGRWTDSLRPLGVPATVFTWRRGESSDPFATRIGGKAPLPRGAAWPECVCAWPMSFVGTLDFRGSPARESVSGDAAVFFHCFKCRQSACHWIRADIDLVLTDHPEAPSRGWIGEGWSVSDYPWDWKSEAAFEDRMDKALVGSSPQFVVTVRGTKTGGYVFWLKQDETPSCACGKPMAFIGQWVGSGDVRFGESGSAALFHCARCRSTQVVLQAF
jgi:hypothetical protein